MFAMTGSAGAASSTFQAPVFGDDFPDPSVLLVGGDYWAYTDRERRPELAGDQLLGSAVLDHPGRPATDAAGVGVFGHTWAPGVIRVGGSTSCTTR